MVFNATFNSISVISWRLVLLLEETGEVGENHRPVASHWQTLSHNAVSSTHHHECRSALVSNSGFIMNNHSKRVAFQVFRFSDVFHYHQFDKVPLNVIYNPETDDQIFKRYFVHLMPKLHMVKESRLSKINRS